MALLVACGMCVSCNILSNMRIQYVYEVERAVPTICAMFCAPCVACSGTHRHICTGYWCCECCRSGWHVDVVHGVICSRAPPNCAWHSVWFATVPGADHSMASASDMPPLSSDSDRSASEFAYFLARPSLSFSDRPAYMVASFSSRRHAHRSRRPQTSRASARWCASELCV